MSEPQTGTRYAKRPAKQSKTRQILGKYAEITANHAELHEITRYLLLNPAIYPVITDNYTRIHDICM